MSILRAAHRFYGPGGGYKMAYSPGPARKSPTSPARVAFFGGGGSLLRKSADDIARYRAPRSLTGCVVRLLDGRNVQVSNDGVLDFPRGQSASGDAHAPVHAALLSAGFQPLMAGDDSAVVVTGGPGSAKRAAATDARAEALFRGLRRTVPAWAGRG